LGLSLVGLGCHSLLGIPAAKHVHRSVLSGPYEQGTKPGDAYQLIVAKNASSSSHMLAVQLEMKTCLPTCT